MTGMEPSKNVMANESCYKLQHLNIGSQKLQDSMFTLHIKSPAFLIKQVPLVVPCGKTGDPPPLFFFFFSLLHVLTTY